jgi:hypothetical protein
MTPAEAQKAVRGYVAAGRWVVSPHAQERMRQRHVRYVDVRNALVHARSCSAEGRRWRVDGPDMDGDPLQLVVVIDDGLVVVTVF